MPCADAHRCVVWCAATFLRLLVLHRADVRAEQGWSLPPEEDSDDEVEQFGVSSTRTRSATGIDKVVAVKAADPLAHEGEAEL